MTDVMPALKSFQKAYKAGSIALEPATWSPGLGMVSDHEWGTLRITYAKIEGKEVLGVAIYCAVPPRDGLTGFQVGYAVAEKHRRKGVCSALLAASLHELIHGFRAAKVTDFFVEAVVGVDNLASNKIALKLLSANPTEIVDQSEGEPALQYLKRITRTTEIGK